MYCTKKFSNYSLGKPIYNHRYDDADGILDLELIPTHKSNYATATNAALNTTNSNNAGSNTTANDFITWGPDFRSQEAFRTTGTFHVRGPVLVENSQYGIRVAIIAKDNKMLSPPLSDTFSLLPKIRTSNSTIHIG